MQALRLGIDCAWIVFWIYWIALAIWVTAVKAKVSAGGGNPDQRGGVDLGCIGRPLATCALRARSRRSEVMYWQV